MTEATDGRRSAVNDISVVRVEDSRVVENTDAWIRARPWVADTGLAALLAVLLLSLSVSTVLDSSWSTAARGGMIAVLIAGHLAIVVRRTAAFPAFLVVSTMCLLLVCAPDLDGPVTEQFGAAIPPVLLPSTLLFPVVLYSIAAIGTRMQGLIAAGIAAVGAVAVAVRLWLDQIVTTGPAPGAVGPADGWLLFLIPAVVGCTLAPWSLGRLQRARRRFAASEHEVARLAERAQLAREIHDVVSHSLAVMVSQAEGGRMMAESRPDVAKTVLTTIAETGREAMDGMHGLLDTLDPRGRGDAPPQPTLADVPAVVDRVLAAGVPVHVEVVGAAGHLSPTAELTAYRVIQESLTNVLKHAPAATEVLLRLDWSSTALIMTICNDGAGPDLHAPSSGRGLPGLRRRLSAVGGELRVTDADDGRFEVSATIPRTETR